MSREHRSCLTPADRSAGTAGQSRARSDAAVLGNQPGGTLRVMLLDAPKGKA